MVLMVYRVRFFRNRIFLFSGFTRNYFMTRVDSHNHTENPKLLVTYHRIYHMNIQDNRKNLAAEMAWRDEAILDEIREGRRVRLFIFQTLQIRNSLTSS